MSNQDHSIPKRLLWYKEAMNHAILLAAGNGKRAQIPHKQHVLLAGKPLFGHALSTLRNHPQIHTIVLVIQAEKESEVKGWLQKWNYAHIELVHGGETRQESAQKGFEHLKKHQSLSPNDVLLIHNAANPFATEEEITQVLEAAQKFGAAFVAHPVVDTLHYIDSKSAKVVDRQQIWQAQTPQATHVSWHEKALALGNQGTDEMSLLEPFGLIPKVIPASANNFKITFPRDLEFARFLMEKVDIHTGIGMDSHRFDREHKGLTLGGVYLQDLPKCLANSDGDVMIHALCNAISQAMGEGSLGSFADGLFSEKGITDSKVYLEHVLGRMQEKQFSLQQVGFQIEGKQPRIDSIADQLKSSLGKLLSLSPTKIGITATSGEDLTPFGRGEGLQCFATVTLESKV